MLFERETLEKIGEFVEKKDLKSLESLIKEPKRKRVKKSSFRSALMVSPHRVRHLNRLDSLEADVAIINLEDGVSPQLKPVALRLAALALSYIKSGDIMMVVRVNPLDSGGAEEIEFLAPFRPDAFRISKVKNDSDVKKALDLVPDADIHLSIETKEALLNIEKLKLSSRVSAAYLGILDMLADLRIPHSALKISNPTADYILSRFLVGCKTAEIFPVSFVYQDYKNLEQFRKWCLYEREMGFSAKGCISPDQVDIVNEIFGSDFERERAEYIKARFEEMSKRGISGFSDEKYGFIDEPIYKDALNILRKFNN